MKIFRTCLPALLSALLLFLASPGATAWPLLAGIALVPLFSALRTSRPRRAFILGLVCGLAFYISILYWIVPVLGRYGPLPWWLACLAMLLLAFYMALYLALGAAIICWAGRVTPILWTAPLVWVALDQVRGHLFTGFPWMDLGYILYQFPLLIQPADLFGHSFITFLLVLTNGIGLEILSLATGRDPASSLPGRLLSLLPAMILVLVSLTYGAFRYRQVEATALTAPAQPVAVVQGDIPQDLKWEPAFQKKTIDTYIALSREALAQQPGSLLIWPETALPFYPDESALFPYLVNHLLTPAKTDLLTGSPSRSWDPATGTMLYFNSGLLVNPAGVIIDKYDKQHLVPFGEYIPLRRFLPGSTPLVNTIGDFTPGRGARPLALGTRKIGLLICFEAIFPALARTQTGHGATLLANITNDAWFGRTSAPWQHLAMTVFRAVENRRGLARAANTGISAVIGPSGRIIQTSPLFEPFFLTARLPLLDTETFYRRHGYLFANFCLFLVCSAVISIKLLTDRHPRGKPGTA